MEQATINDTSPVAGKSLSEAATPQKTGLIIIAVRKRTADEDFVFNPVAGTRLEPDDEMIVLGQEDQLVRLKEYIRG